jgi:predicted aldo/keto reductase-like oxidoreductase
MDRATLGRTGIEVSRLGIGTGTERPAGTCAQRLMSRDELAGLLLHALDRGINHWDTALQYGTYPHIRHALRSVPRSEVVLSTKLVTIGGHDTTDGLERSLKEVGTDYFDVCLMHGVRSGREFRQRMGVLDALLRFKEQGKLRAVGFSSHGLDALRHGLGVDEIDVVWARVNHAGLNMDSSRLGLYDTLASVPWLKKVKEMLPDRALGLIRPRMETRNRADAESREEVRKALEALHARGKGIIGMKVMANGLLANDPEQAIRYVRGLPFLDAFIIGMLTREEIDMNARLADRSPGQGSSLH